MIQEVAGSGQFFTNHYTVGKSPVRIETTPGMVIQQVPYGWVYHPSRELKYG